MFISTITDYDDPTDAPFDIKKVTWYTVKNNLKESQKELDEKAAAIKKQIASGIIQSNGLPAGITPAMLGMKERPPVNMSQMLPQDKMRLLRQQQQQVTFRNEPKPTPQQQFYSKFGIRK